MRIASSTLSIVDLKASEACISRNEFINQCIAFALENMENTQEADETPVTPLSSPPSSPHVKAISSARKRDKA